MSALPYFGDAYMADTRHLTLEEHGAYHLLLLIAWRSPNCALPNDDKRIAQMLGITPKKWAALKPVVMAFWTRTKNGWEQKRLTKERRWVEEKKSKNSNSAHARWNAKSQKTNEPDDANAYPNASANEHANGYAPLPLPLKEESYTSVYVSDQAPTDTPEEPLTVNEIVEAWNSRMVPKGFPAVQRVTGTRLKHLKARIRENTVADFQRAMSALERSKFCRGENREGWRADFDFFCQSKSFTKLLEGAYEH